MFRAVNIILNKPKAVSFCLLSMLFHLGKALHPECLMFKRLLSFQEHPHMSAKDVVVFMKSRIYERTVL